MRTLQVAGPESGTKSVFRAVGNRQRFFIGLESQHGHERAEDFFLCDTVLGRACAHNRWFDIAAAGQVATRCFAAGENLTALLARDFDIGQYTVAMHLAGQWAHLGIWVERIAEPYRLGQCCEFFEKFFCNRFMQHQTRTGDAGLTLVMENRPRCAIDSCWQKRIFKHNVGALAAEFELHFFQITGRGFDDTPTGGSRSGERNLRDLLMLGNVLTSDAAQTRQHIDHAFRHARFHHQLGDAQGRQWRDFRRLHHNAIARGECRRHFPAGEHQWKIPWHDLPNHTQRLTGDIVQKTLLDRHHITLVLVGHATEVTIGDGRTRHVKNAGVTNRMTSVE